MLFRREGSANWWVQFKHRGQRYRFSTGQSDRKAAEIEARRIRVQVDQTAVAQDSSDGVTLAVLEQLHIEHLGRRGRNEKRIKTVENLWKNLSRHMGEKLDVMTLTASDIEHYEGARRKDRRHGQAVRGQTIRREVQALRKGLKLAKRDKLIPRMPFDLDDLDPIEGDAPKRTQEAKVRELSDIHAVFDALSTKAKTAGHDKMLRFILFTGLRLEEFRRFDASWVKPSSTRGIKALLSIPADSSKTGDARVVPLSKEALAIAKEQGPQFAGKKFNHALTMASKAADVAPVVTPRDLRATYLDLAAKSDPLAAQKLAGHRNIATTGLYLDASTARAMAAGAKAARAAGATVKGPQRKQAKKKA